jgi:hypothetical protein
MKHFESELTASEQNQLTGGHKTADIGCCGDDNDDDCCCCKIACQSSCITRT